MYAAYVAWVLACGLGSLAISLYVLISLYVRL